MSPPTTPSDAPRTEPPGTDVVVVGSGLGGLMAANRLQAAGRQVLLIEKHSHAGGKCGAFEVEGYRFTRGCNEFGGGMLEALKEVGAEVEFKPSSTLLNLGDQLYRLPPDLWTGLRLALQAPALVRLVLAVRKGLATDLASLLAERVRNPQVEGIASMLAYASGMPPSAMDVRELAEEFNPELGYKHNQQVVPVGGPQAITDALLARFAQLGGRLRLSTDCLGVANQGEHKLVHTTAGLVTARHVVTSQAHTELKDPSLKRGLSASQILMVLPRSFSWIPQRAFVHMPLHAERWLTDLDEGRMPEQFGFHLFADQVTEEHTTLTGFCILPRGEDEPSQARVDQVFAYIFARLERVMPGFRDAVRFQRFLGPTDYIAEHGVRSELSRVVATEGWQAPAHVDRKRGLIHVGNGMTAPGQHAMAAVRSGSLAASSVLEGGVGQA